MNGLLGLNCRVLGVSRDMIMSAAKQISGAFILIQDDAELVPIAKAAGFRTIYRQSGDETLSLDPATFVQTRAEKGADYTYLTNEIDPTPELLDWTRKAIDYATPRGIRLCVFNFSTDRSAAQWNASAELCLYAARRNHAIGLHVYQRNDQDSSVHNWLSHKQSVGGLWLVTELAWYVDAYHGWRSQLSPWQYSAFLDKTLPLFQREQMPVLCFSGDNWPGNDQGKASGFGVLDSADMLGELARVNTKYSWSEKPVTQSPNRESLGDPIVATVISTAANVVNDRADVSRSAAVLTTFAVGDTITLRPTPTPEVYDTFHWYAIESPKVGWSAAVFKWIPSAPVEDWIVNLDIPYVSQTDAQAQRSQNDCSIACLLMLERYWYTQHGLRAPIYPTVDDLEKYTPLAIPAPNTPHGLNFTDIAALARATGFETQYIRPMTPDVITAGLQAGKPCLVLVDYAAFNPTKGEEFAHFAIVKGFSENYFNCADPYGVDNYRVSRTQLDAAMKLVVGNALGYQGVTLAA